MTCWWNLNSNGAGLRKLLLSSKTPTLSKAKTDFCWASSMLTRTCFKYRLICAALLIAYEHDHTRTNKADIKVKVTCLLASQGRASAKCFESALNSSKSTETLLLLIWQLIKSIGPRNDETGVKVQITILLLAEYQIHKALRGSHPTSRIITEACDTRLQRLEMKSKSWNSNSREKSVSRSMSPSIPSTLYQHLPV